MVTQAERLAKLEVSSQYIKDKLDDFIDSADSKYAVKNVERVVYALVGIILTTVVVAIASGAVQAFN